jgi:hypothetical protein
MVEMQLRCADAELMEYLFDALVDRGVVGAVASDKFFDNRAYRSGCQQPMGNEHRPISSGGDAESGFDQDQHDWLRISPRIDHLAPEATA